MPSAKIDGRKRTSCQAVLPRCRRNMVGSLPRGMPKVVDYRQTGAQAMNEMMTQDRHEVLSRFSHREGVIPTSCVWLYCCLSMRLFFRGVPCPPYMVWGTGLQIWKLILTGYNCHIWPDNDSYSNRPGSYLISKSALIPCAGLRADWSGRASSSSGLDPLVWADSSLVVRV